MRNGTLQPRVRRAVLHEPFERRKRRALARHPSPDQGACCRGCDPPRDQRRPQKRRQGSVPRHVDSEAIGIRCQLPSRRTGMHTVHASPSVAIASAASPSSPRARACAITYSGSKKELLDRAGGEPGPASELGLADVGERDVADAHCRHGISPPPMADLRPAVGTVVRRCLGGQARRGRAGDRRRRQRARSARRCATRPRRRRPTPCWR